MKKYFTGLVLSMGVARAYASDLYVAPNCPVEAAAADLDAGYLKMERCAHPLASSLPWPGVYGGWVNQDNGVYIRVTALQGVYESKWMKVELRSVCSGRLIGKGIRQIEKADYSHATLDIMVSNYVNNKGDFMVRIYPPLSEGAEINMELYGYGHNPDDLIDHMTAVKRPVTSIPAQKD